MRSRDYGLCSQCGETMYLDECISCSQHCHLRCIHGPCKRPAEMLTPVRSTKRTIFDKLTTQDLDFIRTASVAELISKYSVTAKIAENLKRHEVTKRNGG